MLWDGFLGWTKAGHAWLQRSTFFSSSFLTLPEKNERASEKKVNPVIFPRKNERNSGVDDSISDDYDSSSGDDDSSSDNNDLSSGGV